jgi:hypothetical protein
VRCKEWDAQVLDIVSTHRLYSDYRRIKGPEQPARRRKHRRSLPRARGWGWPGRVLTQSRWGRRSRAPTWMQRKQESFYHHLVNLHLPNHSMIVRSMDNSTSNEGQPLRARTRDSFQCIPGNLAGSNQGTASPCIKSFGRLCNERAPRSLLPCAVPLVVFGHDGPACGSQRPANATARCDYPAAGIPAVADRGSPAASRRPLPASPGRTSRLRFRQVDSPTIFPKTRASRQCVARWSGTRGVATSCQGPGRSVLPRAHRGPRMESWQALGSIVSGHTSP